MTSHQLFRLVLRRWYVFVLGMVLAAAAAYSFNNIPRVYTANTEISFSAPLATSANASQDDNTETLIDFAGVVMRLYNTTQSSFTLSSPTASLFGNGIRHGISVDLSKSGNQWTVGFNRPTILISVIGSSSEEVMSRLNEVTTSLIKIAENLQSASGTPSQYFITASTDLDDVSITSFGQTKSGKLKGTVTLFVMALVLSTVAATAVDRIYIFKSRRPARGENPRETSRRFHAPLIGMGATIDES